MIPTVKQAKEILKKHIKKEQFLTHNLEVGKAMKALAKYYDENIELWEIIGILHDIDLEKYGEEINKHCIIGENILQNENIDQEIIDIIKTHNDALNIKRTKKVEHCLYAADGLTGLIHAYVLMRPDKDIQKAKTKSIMKKFKDKAFAKGVSREEIRSVEKTLNMPVKEFIEIVLEGMKK
jgi:putative nucleotidyltransferase with HDIG domain